MSGDGRHSVATVPVLNPVNMCDVKHTPKHSRADGGAHTLGMLTILIQIELRATEPAEDPHHLLKTHTAVL